MIIDRDLIQEYPFNGSFYTYGIDMTKPLTERVEEEILVLETKCDIQEAKKSDNTIISNAFEVYYPFDKKQGITIKKGMLFRGGMFGMPVEGRVIGLFPTQLGGVSVYITTYTQEE